jgi:DNA-binding transcriptional MerR regulator/methylmalonyl-CoA mutase cobalamin-binding subunit
MEGSVTLLSMIEAHQSIRAVSRRTGLSPHVIRIWERRYGAVEPDRTDTNRRRYSDADIERLGLLRELTQAGHTIGAVAQLPTGRLRQLAAERGTPDHGSRLKNARRPTAAVLTDKCLAAVQTLDARELERLLKRASISLGTQGVLQRVIAPLVQTIGDRWQDGSITAAHEHFATAVIRVFLGNATNAFAATEPAPILVVATPSGQLHELGALLAGAAAANLGWRVTYLGASLPAAEIAGAARSNRARAVALSVVYPEDDPRLESELIRLRDALPRDVAVLVGGRAAPAYRKALDRIGARQLDTLDDLCTVLSDLRKPDAAPTR